MFRFSVRELLLLMLVVALAAGWIVDRRSSQQEARRFWDMVVDADRERGRGRSDSATLRLNLEALAEQHNELLAENARLAADNAKLRRWLLERDTQRELELRFVTGK